MEQQSYGFIGVGRMGGLMSARLLKAGHPVVVYDVAREAVAQAILAAGQAPERTH